MNLVLALALLRAPIVVTAGPAPHALEARTLEATLKAAGTREPIAGARVMVVPAEDDAELGVLAVKDHLAPADAVAWVRTVQTDDAGRVRLGDLEATRVRVVVVAPGFVRHEEIVDLDARTRRGLVVFVQPEDGEAFRTIVETEAEAPAERVKSTPLSAEEIRTAPGTQGDPLRALQNLPGVARSPGGFGILVLRGASPNQSRVFLGGHPIPRAFHSLATSSVVPAAAIDSMEFVPGNFDARFGDATGGVVLLEPARLQRERVHGHARLDLLGAGAVASGPVGEGAYLVAAQRGWIDAVLGVAELVDPNTPFLMPRYYDYQAFLDHPVGARGQLTVRALGAGDRLQSRVYDPFRYGDRQVTAFELVSQFQRADLSYRARQGPWSFWVTPSFRFERNGTRQPPVDVQSIRDDYVFSLRAEASRRISRRFQLLAGADLEIDRYRAQGRQPTNIVTGEAAIDFVRRGVQTSMGAYTHASVDVGQWELSAGVRLSAFTLGATSRAAVDPRLNAHWSFAPRWRWSVGAGLYSQARVQQTETSGGFITGTASQLSGNVILPASLLALEPRSGFLPAAGGLAVSRSLQASTALRRELGESWLAEIAAWGRITDDANGLRRLEDGGVEPVTSTWSNAYGLEVLVRRTLGPKLWGWVGYTLSTAQVRVLDQIGRPLGPASAPSDFDQRHNLVVLGSYRLPRRWRIGGRFRLVSGSPFTDVVGRTWVPSVGAQPGWGAPNAERFPLFHQLDLRVDKSWVLRRVEVGAYIDVQNVYNRLNPEAYIYNADFSRRADAVGLPIFPSLGVQVDY